MKKRLAIFDIDGTIFRSSLLISLVDGLIKDGVFPESVKKEIEKDYLDWINRKGQYSNYISKVVEVYFKYLKGSREDKLKKVAQKVILKDKDKVYRFTRDLIKELQKKNYFLLAISGSPSYMVSYFTNKMGFDHYIASEFEVINGVFTGKPILLPAKGKGGLLLNFISSSKTKFDLKNSIAVGDEIGDVEMLEVVGNPIAFNPTSELASYAKKKKWRIVLERKDAVFDLKDFKITS